MSVKAYRINNIDREQEATFNVWYDEKLMVFLSVNYSTYLGANENGGMVEVPTKALKEVISKAKELDLDGDTVKAIKADLKWAKENGQSYVLYDCY